MQTKTHPKEPQDLWKVETKNNMYQMLRGNRKVWRKIGNAHNPKHTTKAYHMEGVLWLGLLWLPVEWAHLSSSMMWLQTEVKQWILKSTEICSDKIKCLQTYWLALHHLTRPETYCKSSKGFFLMTKNGKILDWNIARNKQELKLPAVQAWQSITREDTQRLVMSIYLKEEQEYTQTQAQHCYQ